MKITLLSKPTFDCVALQEFLDKNNASEFEFDRYSTDSARLVETAGRVCYMSFEKPRPGGNPAYIKHILEVGHGSVLEAANFSFLIEGVSRSLTHEIVRHRAGVAYSQLSQRYVNEANAEMIVPPDMENDHESVAIARSAWDRAKSIYSRLFARRYRQRLLAYHKILPFEDQFPIPEDSSNEELEKKIPRDKRTEFRKASRQEARCVLPNATETTLVMTGNIRAWRHILEMRGSLHADAEIRRFAVEMYRQLSQVADVFFSDFSVKTDTVHGEYLSNLYKKV